MEDLQRVLEYRNRSNRFCQRLGMVVTELSLGYAKVVKTVTEEDLNPVGTAMADCFSPWRTTPPDPPWLLTGIRM